MFFSGWFITKLQWKVFFTKCVHSVLPSWQYNCFYISSDYWESVRASPLEWQDIPECFTKHWIKNLLQIKVVCKHLQKKSYWFSTIKRNTKILSVTDLQGFLIYLFISLSFPVHGISRISCGWPQPVGGAGKVYLFRSKFGVHCWSSQ